MTAGCKIICESYAVDSAGRELHTSLLAHAHYATATKCRCQTHGMPMSSPVGMGDLCPIGKIEAATEAAIAELRAELKKMRQ